MHEVNNHATKIGFCNMCASIHALGGEHEWQLWHVYMHLVPKELNSIDHINSFSS